VCVQVAKFSKGSNEMVVLRAGRAEKRDLLGYRANRKKVPNQGVEWLGRSLVKIIFCPSKKISE